MGHVKFLGWLHVISFFALAACLALELMLIVTGSDRPPESAFGFLVNTYQASLLGVYDTIYLFFNLLVALPFGLGLLYYKEWARLLGIFLAALTVVDIIIQLIFRAPDYFYLVIAAVVAIYIYWVMTRKDVKALFSGDSIAAAT